MSSPRFHLKELRTATGRPDLAIAARLQEIEVALAKAEDKHWLAAVGSVFAGCSENAITLYFAEIGWSYFAWPGHEFVAFCEEFLPYKRTVANLKTHVTPVLYRVILDMLDPQEARLEGA